MARILYLTHRVPYPPDKGDKVRSYHLLRHLSARHEIALGTFVDDPDDEAHVDALRTWCNEVKAISLNPVAARLRALGGLLLGQPLTLTYYRNAALRSWSRAQRADAAVVFSSSMAQFVEGFGGPVLVDFVDVDSAKWTEYASRHRWPISALYRREGRTLLAHERQVAARANCSFFVTDRETALFAQLAPECAARIRTAENGVDTDYFAPDAARSSPYDSGEIALVFTGVMDYWPNVDAVVWFAQSILPELRRQWPRVRLSIVGRNPTSTVRSLAGEAVRVTGTVPDVRPWLQHAAIVIAPLRLARGIQNKVLEAMAMARPVVAATACVDAIDAEPGVHLASAGEPADYISKISGMLSRPDRAEAIGQAARCRVSERYGWAARLDAVDACLHAELNA
jgi:sugar transferase (PEP-CTERM/EpsH1 system associated)